MATAIPFDLNAAFHNWRENLQQSPHFRAENLEELETHLRDSVTVLQGKGLAADEAFLIGTRRVGTPEALEGQFAAENGGRGWRDALRRSLHNYKDRLLHLLILAYFTFGCWLLWGCLRVSQLIEPLAVRAHVLAKVDYIGAPAFTRLFWGLMPYWYLPPVFAALYCGFVWTRKSPARSSWFAFFSFAMAFLFLLLIPILIASELPVISFLYGLPPKMFQTP
jgi:hypothetical protein